MTDTDGTRPAADAARAMRGGDPVPPPKPTTISQEHPYDFIIAGMGCAGLSLAVHLAESGVLGDRRVLLLERAPKDSNDRTWCFWETQPGPFEAVVHRQWRKAWFHTDGYSSLLELSPFAYKMIRAVDYYAHCLRIVASHPGFEVRYAGVTAVSQDAAGVTVTTTDGVFRGGYLFNSILEGPLQVDPRRHHLLQHFKGWVIETPDDRFVPDEPTLMDFRPSQRHGTTFVYVMPFGSRSALVEYTLFTERLLPENEYREGLEAYIRGRLGIGDFTVAAEEFGVIPMTNHVFPAVEGRVLNIGTAGGQTKASSGYTFRFIQKQSAAIIASLRAHGHPLDVPRPGRGRFAWYDSILLHILRHRILEGSFIFGELFRRNHPSTILRFLDNESALVDELRIMNSLPRWPFMKAGLSELFR